jgi:hypothetical protein
VDRIKEMLDQLSELSEGEVADLEGLILSEFETVEKQEPSQQVVETMTLLADALDAVRSEQTSRVAAQQELAAAAAEAASRVHGADTAEQMPEEEPSDEEDTEPELPPEEEIVEEKDEEVVMSTKSEEFSESEPSELAVEDESTPATPAEAEAAVEEAPVEEPVAEAAVEEEETAELAVETPEASTETTEPAEVASVEDVATDTPAEFSADTPGQPTNEEIPVAASATDVVVTPPAANQPVPTAKATVSVTAGADIPGYTAGTEFSNRGEVSDAFMKRLHSIRRATGGDGEQHIIASIHADFPEDRVLHAGDQAGNWEKIQKITSREALIAAAVCYPLETNYSIFGSGTADRPVRDSLAVFNAERGGLRYYTAPTVATGSYTDGMGRWDQTGNTYTAASGFAAETSPVDTKPCYVVECGEETEALVEALSMCLTFDNLTTRAFPELIERHNEVALIQHARYAETYLLNELKNGGTAVTATNYNVGAAREFVAQLDGIASAYRYKYRLQPNEPMRFIAPYWFLDMLRADIAMQMPGDSLDTLALAESKINSWLSSRRINPTWSLDSVVGGPNATTGAFPSTVEWDLFVEGTWLYLDGGTLDLGVIRDSTLVGTNDYKMFTEEFIGLAKVGDESLHVTSTLQASGAAAALEDNFS